MFNLFFVGCKQEKPIKKTEPVVEEKRDLDQIKEDKTLRVLIENNPASYFIYKGRKMGYEYEILKLFAEHIDVKLDLVMINDLDEMIPRLKNEEGDLIACNLTVTRKRGEEISFSSPFLSTRQVLVQRKPEGWRRMSTREREDTLIRKVVDLGGKTVHVWENSSFYQRLKNLSEEIGDSINVIPTRGNLNTQELIRQVSEGEIEYTIADENVAKINLHFYDNIDVATPISMYQNIAFGLRKDAVELKAALDEWIESMEHNSTFNHIHYKYFDRRIHANESASEFSSVGGDKISPYDELIKQEAEKVGWDWQLIAAIIYQESKFVHNKSSFAGAYGVMQFMPETAKAYGVDEDSSPHNHIVAGIRKLNKNFNELLEEIKDSTQALKFTLATYNAGRGHIADARALTEKYGQNPNVWDKNVENFILRLSKRVYYEDPVVKYGYVRGDETYRYVREIFDRYHSYQNLYP